MTPDHDRLTRTLSTTGAVTVAYDGPGDVSQKRGVPASLAAAIMPIMRTRCWPNVPPKPIRF